jgi:hypothetical protein
MTNFVLIHDDTHTFTNGVIDIPVSIASTGLTSINKAYIEVSLLVPLTTIDKPNLLGFLYQESGSKRSKPYPIISQQQSLTLDFSVCDNFIFSPTNRLIDDYGLKLYVANDSVSGSNSGNSNVDLTNYVTNQSLAATLDDYLLDTTIPYSHSHSMSDITGLNTVLDDHEDRLDIIESSPPSSSSLTIINTNQVLESNKSYFVNTSGLILTLPNNPNIGDYINIYNGNFDTRVNHGNTNQVIKNNTTDTLSGVSNGIILKPYSAIKLLYVGNNLWLSSTKIRAVNNWQVPTVSATIQKQTYTATALEAYSYWDSNNNLTAINNNSDATGVLKTGGGTTNKLMIIATLSSSIELHQIQIYGGQFNSITANLPATLSIYKGDSINQNNLIQTIESIASPNNRLITLQSITTDNVFAFEFSGGAWIGVLEMSLFGKSIVGGEITIS